MELTLEEEVRHYKCLYTQAMDSLLTAQSREMGLYVTLGRVITELDDARKELAEIKVARELEIEDDERIN